MGFACMIRCVDGSTVAEPDLVVAVTSPSLGDLMSIRTNDRPLGEYLASTIGTGQPLASVLTPTLVVERLQHPWPRWSIKRDNQPVSMPPFGGVVGVIMRTVLDRVREMGLTIFAASAVDFHGSCMVLRSTDRLLEAEIVAALERNGASVVSQSEVFVAESGELVATHLPMLIESWHPMWATWSEPPIEGLTTDSQLVEWSRIARASDAATRKVDLVVDVIQSGEDQLVLEPTRQAQVALDMLSRHGAASVTMVEALLRRARCVTLTANRAEVDSCAQLILSELR